MSLQKNKTYKTINSTATETQTEEDSRDKETDSETETGRQTNRQRQIETDRYRQTPEACLFKTDVQWKFLQGSDMK